MGAGNKATIWTFAGLVSVGFHAVLLMVWFALDACFSGGETPSNPPSAQTPSPAAESAPPPKASPAPSLAPSPAPAEPRASSVTPAWVDRVSLETPPPPPKTPSRPAGGSERVSPSPRAQTPAPAAEPEGKAKYYVVKRGDNLTRIAQKDGSTLAELAKLNGTTVSKLSKLWVGQKIKLKNGIE